MKFGTYLTDLREKRNLTKKEFSDKLGLTPGYILNIEKGNNNPPPLDRIHQIIDILSLNEKERKYLLSLAREERFGHKDIAFQQAIQGSDFGIIESVQEALPPIIEWSKLSYITLPPNVAKNNERENSMYRVKIKDSKNEPFFKKGDELVIGSATRILNGRCYLVRDRVTKRVFLHQPQTRTPIATNPERTISLKIDEQSNNSVEILGMVLKLIRRM